MYGFLVELKPQELPEGQEPYTYYIAINAPSVEEASQKALAYCDMYGATYVGIAATYNMLF